MQWNDIGYLISKTRYNENSLIAEFFTEFSKISSWQKTVIAKLEQLALAFLNGTFID